MSIIIGEDPIRDKRQSREPFLEACEAYIASHPTPFDVPGHKMGRMTTDLAQMVGKDVFVADFNAPLGLDNLYHPHGVIKEAEDLAAEAFGADKAIFSVNGTTGGILTMINALLHAKDKIILPRNVHKSVINALIMSGAYPVFVEPDIDEITGIANGLPTENVIKAMEDNPDAKAVFVINPTYFGIASDLKTICEEAHKRNMIVICDEAHGAHFHFTEKVPLAAMDAGADITTMSVHKTAGSLTQTSLILVKGNRIDFSRVSRVFGMLSSTSPNHILIASLDAARKFLYFSGREYLDRSIDLADYARSEINKIPGLSCLDSSYCDRPGRFALDPSKLVVTTSGLGISGFDVLREMREIKNVQLELAEVSEVLAVFGLGTQKEDADILIDGFRKISEKHFGMHPAYVIPHFHYSYPEMIVRPREAFNAPSKIVPLKDSVGEISAESIMIYPPGIPIAIPGELITKDALDLIAFYQAHGGVLLSDSPEGYIHVIDQSIWYKGSDIDYEY
jgi:arginine decarboxylase